MKQKFQFIRRNYDRFCLWFERKELSLFWVLIIFNLLPALAGKYFITLDGAAHLHNARLYLEMIFHPNGPLQNFYVLNELVPNATSTWILALLLSFLPAFLAEKIFILAMLILTPLGFRYLLCAFPTSNKLFSYFIFPFTYSYIFLLGFYNFSFGLICLFFSLGYWIRNRNQRITSKSFLTLFLLLMLTYFSHIFIFAFLILFIAMEILTATIFYLIREKDQRAVILKYALSQALTIISASVIPIFLLVQFFLTQTSISHDFTYLTIIELISYITDLRPIIAYNFDIEGPFTLLLLSIFVVLSLTAVLLIIKKLIRKFPSRNKKTKDANTIFPFTFWLSTFGIVVIAYFLMPDQMGIAGYISVRLALLLFLLLILWLSTTSIPKRFVIALLPLLTIINGYLTAYYFYIQYAHKKVAISIEEAVDLIEPYKIILPLDFTGQWLLSNISNYAGIDKAIVILDNYEASSGTFLLKWNPSGFPNILLGTKEKALLPCAKWHTNYDGKTSPADYVLVTSDINHTNYGCHQEIYYELENFYEIIYRSAHCTLYVWKPSI